MKLNKFLVGEAELILVGLQRIESNHHGLVFINDAQGVVKGVATDGDIRRYLLSSGSLDDKMISCANHAFVWELQSTPRELLLKKLDNHIKIIPLLDASKRLVGIVTNGNVPLIEEESVYARARAPVRVSFGGGGSDLTHYFAENHSGAVINATISLYSHATLRVRNDKKIIVDSLDLNESLLAEDLHDALTHQGQFGLVQALLRVINPSFGFELFISSDFPTKSGLGGSAVVSAAILGCFNELRRDKWDLYELAEMAYQAERHYLGISGGWQDQYATVFGGFNFMEFRMDQNIVHPLRIHNDTLLELEESLILCDTGTKHDSNNIHQDQRIKMKSASVREMVKNNVKLSYEMRNDLLRGRLFQFGKSLDKAWQLKREFSDKISSSRLDQIYSDAKSKGAVGGKLLGAGGGGFFLFYVPPYQKNRLISHLEASGLTIRTFRFEQHGLQTWKMRESRNHQESEVL